MSAKIQYGDSMKVGRKYGLWTIIGKPVKSGHSYKVMCRCACGAERLVTTYSLYRGVSRSCRCGTKTAKGYATHPLYEVWKLMHHRCYGKKVPAFIRERYQKRGITICNSWRESVAAFVEWGVSHGWKKGLQIDRIDNDKGYSPENCRFVTPSQNSRNRGNNTFITYKGERHCIAEWAEITGMSQDIISQRYSSNHWSAKKTFETPVRKRRSLLATPKGGEL